MSGQGRH